VATPTPWATPSPVNCTYNAANMDSTGITNNVTWGGLTIDSQHNFTGSSGVTLTFAPGNYYFNNFTVTGGASIVTSSAVNAANPVCIYCTGNIDFTGGSAINNNSKISSSVRLYTSSTSSSAVTLDGGNLSYLTVYAPLGTVSLSGGTDFYGAIVASTFADTGGVNLHYDQALAGTDYTVSNASASPTPVPGTTTSTTVSVIGWNRQ
jgi:hypothetical protein